MASVETARLTLRRLRETDLDAYYKCIYADPEVMKTLLTGAPISRQAFNERVLSLMVDHWTRHGFGPWVVIHTADQTCIGHCGLKYWPESPDVEVFYALDTRYWGRGLATEAARACLRFGFETLQLERIIAAVMPDNRASRRVLEKIGMRYTGETQMRRLSIARYVLEQSAYTVDHSFDYSVRHQDGNRITGRNSTGDN
jgi:RimJ/RimL family protein N-acetyltransferase